MLFAALCVIKTITGLSYKNLEGLCKESLGDSNAPDHSTIHARINNLDISFDVLGYLCAFFLKIFWIFVRLSTASARNNIFH